MTDATVGECLESFSKGLRDETMGKRERAQYDAVVLASQVGERARRKAEGMGNDGSFAFAGAFLTALNDYLERFEQ